MSRMLGAGTVLLISAGVIGLRPCAPRLAGAPGAGPDAAKPADQAAKVTVGPNVHVSKPRAEFPHHEVILAADPKTPGRLLAGSMIQYVPGGDRMNTIGYVSADGGRSWQLTLEWRGHRRTGDPAVAYGPDGAAYFATLRADPPDPGRDPDPHIEVFRSKDGGRTWADPVQIRAVTDRQYLAVDSTGGKYNGRVYANTQLAVDSLNGGFVQALGLFTSRDGGKTFGSPLYRVVTPPSIDLINANSVVLSDGAVAMLYVLNHANTRTQSEAAKKPVPPEAAADVIGIAVSADGGESLLKRPPGQGRVGEFLQTRRSGIPVLAADPGGAFKDRLYAAWADAVPPPQRCYRVMFASSRDKGATWSKAVILSEQPDGKGYDSFMPSVAVNKDGVVGVSWYDTRYDTKSVPATETGWDVRFRASLDGGETWQPSVRVTDETTVLTDERRRKAPKDEHLYYRAPGDTAGLAADADGVFHPLWVDGRTGVRQVWTAAVTVKARR